ISSRVSTFAFSKCPIVGSANHGGIVLLATALAMARAYGRVSWNVRNDIGAIAPGRWHSWQFFWRIGSTSLLKVGAAGDAAETAVVSSSAATAMTMRKRQTAGTTNRLITSSSRIVFLCDLYYASG